MTGYSPKIWAAADLDPVSPAPVHPPSPIIVPELQDQADSYLNMPFAGSNLITLAVPNPAEIPKVNGQTHVPSANVHYEATNGAPDTPVDPEQIDLGKAVNGGVGETETVSVGVNAENMQEPKTLKPEGTETEQDVSKSIESTHNSVTSSLASAQVDIAALAHEYSPPASQLSPDRASASPLDLTSQPSHKPPENKHSLSNEVVSNADNAQPSQSLSEPSLANNHRGSSATSHAVCPATSIQGPVDNITDRTANAHAAHMPASESIHGGNVLPQSTVLPRKPPTSEPTFIQPYPSADGFPSSISGAPQSSSMPLPLSNGSVLGTYTGTVPEMVDPRISATVTPVVTSIPNHISPVAQSDSTLKAFSVDQPPLFDHQRQRWETFVQDERKYVSEAKWDRFPEGSRIFIGNLSSERVSKKEVFTIFSKFGRLAQISLKQAYGFVQYHTVAEGQAAMQNLQGMEIQGKKINLEFSRTQKKDNEGGRANRGKRDGDRHDGHKGRRDDYRPKRQASPQRSNHRQPPSYDGDSRGRGYRENSYSSDRRRSLSPGHNGRDLYRRRSPSPHRRYTPVADLDLPHRHGPEVPDVQFLLLQDVKRDFVSWAQSAFVNQGLRVDVMYLNPQFPRDAVIQRQVLEGVHAVAELDFRAQDYGRIPLQVFDRSAGYSNSPEPNPNLN
ncbi:hypothetical protein NUW58_g8286 [Xylaria curta]|uniref:Uncharacterized protein n=1 Tax=Xylaria curta TaxID=42375 RepID=A0ACC1N8U4_9PEZI|nr:hypothetical protein NUW58_g8286 [Xylaria curta]